VNRRRAAEAALIGSKLPLLQLLRGTPAEAPGSAGQ
jgi:hypothetical protein